MGLVKPLTYGRCGNFHFQAATAIAYAWRHELEFTLPNTTKDPKSNPIYLQHLVHPKWNPRLPEVKLVEGPHCYQELPFRPEWRRCNIILDGYWQTQKYFQDYRDRILTVFGYEWIPLKNVVSIHIRRGDYLTLTRKHPPVTMDWINRAMGFFRGFSFLVFSDDLEWCREAFKGREDVAISGNHSEIEDLVNMSWCEHHICSASTFSWWGAWLNQNPDKQVIMPNHWFTPGYQRLDTSDIVPPEWSKLV